MTTIQKTLIATVIVAALGAGLYERQSAAVWRSRHQALQDQEAAQAAQLDQAARQLQEAKAVNETLRAENARLQAAASAARSLRAEVTRLHSATAASAASGSTDPFTQSVLALAARAGELNSHLQDMPKEKIPELALLTPNEWLEAAKDAKFDTDADVRKALSKLRQIAKAKLPFGSALFSFTHANNGALPTDLSQLAPYFKFPVDDSIFARYSILHGGNISDLPAGAWIIAEKSPVDPDYDSRAKFGEGTSTVISTGLGETGDTDDPAYGSQ